MRKSKQDWLEQGLKTLSREGKPGLTIDRLAEALGVTKGSFYHHFQNMADYEAQLVAFWAEPFFSTTAALPADPALLQAILDQVISEAFGPSTEPELALRTWAQSDAMVRGWVEKVDGRRRDFLLTVFRAVTGEEKQARLRADMLFTMLTGSLTALPRVPAERVLELYREFKHLSGLE